MTSIKVSILLTLSIFAIVTHVWSDPDKSMNHAANRVTTMKMDKNKGVVQNKREATKKPVKSLKKRKSKSQTAPSRSDDGAIIESAKRDIDFLKVLEEKKELRLTDCINQVLRSVEFSQIAWSMDRLPSQQVATGETDFAQSISKPYPAGSQYFDERRKLEAFRHLESRKEEILTEIFMGFRFSFGPTSRHMFLEMNVTPSSEKGPGIAIPF